ncbi:hypothetical protein [Nitratidesulfovibrio termitidis]|uniref:hypothetical protein n=1 Tax=Nitratidesulfovibrio termitidis TaxID=42252 RepID=UPI000427A286|nr:hypothetical protein [Nitratidesulfovibrio termitidis]
MMTRADCGHRRGDASDFIRRELRRRNHTMRSLAALIGLSGEAVAKTVRGELHSPRVLDALRDLGVPEKYLFDPRKLAQPQPLTQPERQDAA